MKTTTTKNNGSSAAPEIRRPLATGQIACHSAEVKGYGYEVGFEVRQVTPWSVHIDLGFPDVTLINNVHVSIEVCADGTLRVGLHREEPKCESVSIGPMKLRQVSAIEKAKREREGVA